MPYSGEDRGRHQLAGSFDLRILWPTPRSASPEGVTRKSQQKKKDSNLLPISPINYLTN
jgi:hypothetical protein